VALSLEKIVIINNKALVRLESYAGFQVLYNEMHE
jgi:hypothetical protein